MRFAAAKLPASGPFAQHVTMYRTEKTVFWLCIGLVCGLAGCAGPGGREVDSGPREPVDVSHIPDAVPRPEPRTAAGNTSPYTVLDKRYELLDTAQGYREEGVASWYGRKFHGRPTANGDTYDMYGMTAAHKTLPIPTFVRVTNLENGKEVIVRVNDRGPFRERRLIDLSYAAARKLGYSQQGTARVEVTAIDPHAWAAKNGENTSGGEAAGAEAESAPQPSTDGPLPENTFLQAGAFSSRESATSLQNKLSGLTSYPVFVTSVDVVREGLDKLFRVRVGPISDNWQLRQLRELIRERQLGEPHVVYD